MYSSTEHCAKHGYTAHNDQKCVACAEEAREDAQKRWDELSDPEKIEALLRRVEALERRPRL